MGQLLDVDSFSIVDTVIRTRDLPPRMELALIGLIPIMADFFPAGILQQRSNNSANRSRLVVGKNSLSKLYIVDCGS